MTKEECGARKFYPCMRQLWNIQDFKIRFYVIGEKRPEKKYKKQRNVYVNLLKKNKKENVDIHYYLYHVLIYYCQVLL